MEQDSISFDSREAVPNDNDTVIVISDSSSDCDNPKGSNETKLKSIKRSNLTHRILTDSSSNSEFSNNEAKRMLELWRSKCYFFDGKRNGNTSSERRNILLTSDSDTPSSSNTDEKFIESSVTTKSTYINLTPEKNKRVAVLSNDSDSNGKRMISIEISDKLYRTSQRQKAAELLPKSEPRKQTVGTKSRAVHTERGARTKKIISSSESLDEDSSASLGDLRPPKSSTKRNARVGRKQRDSFINHETSLESGDKSSYYTAVTNPGKSANNVQSKSTVPPRVHRIYNTGSEDERKDEENDRDDMYNMRQKKLYFNDDKSESESSSTNPPKPPQQTIKKGAVVRPNSNNGKYKKTFLASLSENVPIASAHPEAKKYRKDFKNNKETLCNYLYKLYNEKVFDEQLPKDMSIEWNVRMTGTAGFCNNWKSVKSLEGVRKSRIVLSTKVVDTPDRLRDTLIHEMCHAAAWLINNVSDGHGLYWSGWANKAVKTFPELPPIRRCHDYKIKTKFTYKCASCGYSIGRHSKSLDVEWKRCGYCYGKFELLINKTTKYGTVQVKENNNNIKRNRNVKHTKIMKNLGQQFSAVKIAKNREIIENEAPC